MRIWNYVNLCGVLLLVGLSGFQWRANDRASTEARRLELARAGLAVRLATQDLALRADAAERDELHERLSAADALVTDARSRLAAAAATRDALLAERSRYRATVDQWAAAVAARDAALARASDQNRRSQAERDAAINRYNDLVRRFNAANGGQ